MQCIVFPPLDYRSDILALESRTFLLSFAGNIVFANVDNPTKTFAKPIEQLIRMDSWKIYWTEIKPLSRVGYGTCILVVLRWTWACNYKLTSVHWIVTWSSTFGFERSQISVAKCFWIFGNFWFSVKNLGLFSKSSQTFNLNSLLLFLRNRTFKQNFLVEYKN